MTTDNPDDRDDTTPPPEDQAWRSTPPFPAGPASLATVERYHAENKVAHRQLEERLHGLELERVRFTERLTHIDGMLQRIAARVEIQPTRWWPIIASLVPLALVVAAWVWQAARYPDRADFLSVNARLVNVEMEMRVMKVLLDTHDARRRARDLRDGENGR